MQLVNKIAFYDGAALFGLPFLLLFIYQPSVNEFGEKLTNQSIIILPVSVGAALIAAWRGRAYAIQLINGNKSFVRPAFEGFVIGFTLFLLLQIIGFLNEANAAGSIYSSYKSWSSSDWIHLIQYEALYGGLSGVIGTLIAIGVSLLNRAIVYAHKSR